VFRWLAEPELAARWQNDVAGYQVTRRTDAMVGTEFVETLSKGGRSAELRGRIVTFEPDARIGFALSGNQLHVTANYTVQPDKAGVLVHGEIVVDAPGHMPGFLRPLVEWQMRRQLRRELGLLRRLCEADMA
jgi:uncharacterized protein YndB with AHSA1/START domain